MLELRRRLLICLSALFVIALLLMPAANFLYQQLAKPLLASLPLDSHLIATGIVSPLLTPLQLTIWCSFLLSMPIIFYQVWCFVRPGLYQSERKTLRWFLLAANLFFYLGVIFAYRLVMPLLLHILLQSAPKGVLVLPDISQYLDFCLRLLLAFGLAFEIPLMMIALVRLNLISYSWLVKQRPYFIVLAFIIGLIIAPDVVSQCCLAIPLCLLFELGLLLSRRVS